MAGGSNSDPEQPFENNPIFSSIDERIAQILRKCGSVARNDIIEELALEIESKDVEECKDKIFGFAVSKLNQEYVANGGQVPDNVKLELRRRRTIYNHAHDMISLLLYVGGMMSSFPKDVLSTQGTYVELVNKTQGSDPKSGPCQKVNKQEPTHPSTVPSNGAQIDQCCCVDVKEQMKKHVALLLTLKDFILKDNNISLNDLNSAFKVIDFRGSDLHQAVNGQNSTSASNTSDGESNNNATTQPASPSQPGLPAAQPEAQPGTQAKQPASQPGTQANGQFRPRAKSTPEGGANAGSSAQQKPVFIGRKGATVGDMSSDNESKDTSGKWQTKGSGKSGSKNNVKLSGGKPKTSTNAPLTGRSYKTTDLYVQDITRNEGDSLIDIANRVRAHCQGHDIRVTFARVYPKRFCTETVNCRISVPLDDIDKCLGIHIWPDGVVCRRWNKDPPNRNHTDQPSYKGNNGNQYRRNNNNRGLRPRRYYDNDGYESDFTPDHWEDRYNGDERYGGRYGGRR